MYQMHTCDSHADGSARLVVLEGVAGVNDERVEEGYGDEQEEGDQVHGPREHAKPLRTAGGG